MNRNTWYLTTSRFAFAAVLAAGMAGAPLAFDDSVLSLNGAAAQATAPDVNADDEDGAAEEFVENPNSRVRSEEHTSELQSLMRISYAVFCLKKKKTPNTTKINQQRKQNITHINKRLTNVNYQTCRHL